MSFPLDLPTKGSVPSSSRLRLASELASLSHRSAAHLPPTSATPHIPPVPVKLPRDRVDTKGKAKAAYALGQQGVLDHQREAASGRVSGHQQQQQQQASPTTSLNSANSKSKPPVKAKASAKQKRREREKQAKAADFKEKLAVKDAGFEDRKLKRDRAKRAWE